MSKLLRHVFQILTAERPVQRSWRPAIPALIQILEPRQLLSGTALANLLPTSQHAFAVPAVNQAPTNLTLSNNTVAENRVAGTVVGTFTTTDPDTQLMPQTFTYKLVSGTGSTNNASFTIDAAGHLLTAARFNHEVQNLFKIRVQATDQGGLSIQRTFTVGVTNVNEGPTALALSHSTVAENRAAGAFVGAFTTTDPDALLTPQAFKYTLVGGTGSTDNANFTIDANGHLLTAASFNYEVKRTEAIRVRTTDQGGLFTERSFTVGVTNVNESPTHITLSNNAVAENQAAGALVGLFGTNDPDAPLTPQTFKYTLVSGTGSTDNTHFRIDATGHLLTTTVFNYEAKHNFSIRVQATDQGGLSTQQTFTVVVVNVNEGPTSLALLDNTVLEKQTAGALVGSFRTTDPDASLSPQTFKYSLVSGAGSTNNASFKIDAHGNLLTAARFDFAIKQSYTIRVQATDQDGLSTQRSFTVNVNPHVGPNSPNQAPTGISLSNSTVAENRVAGTVVGSFSTTDPDAPVTPQTFTYTLVSTIIPTNNASFRIDANGNLVTAASFDYEAKNSYTIRVRTTDQGGLFTDRGFTIGVTNVNEAPTALTLSNNTVTENLPTGTAVGTFTTTDPDAALTPQTFIYTLAGGTGSTDNANFTIDATGHLLTAASFDFETKNIYSIRVRVTDQGGLFTDQAFTVGVINANEAPTALALSNNTVAENQAAGTVVGSFTTTDPDSLLTPQSFTYTLVPWIIRNDNSSFTIDANGNLLTRVGFDYEARNSYAIRVRTTDQGGLFTDRGFTIGITNVNEAPTGITLTNNSTFDSFLSGSTVGPFNTVDPDTTPFQSFAYKLASGGDNAAFTIDSNGNLGLARQLNVAGKTSYTITVTSTDQGGLSVTKDLTITVKSGADGFTLSASTAVEGLVGGGYLGQFSTGYSGTSSTSYELAGNGDNDAFEITTGFLRNNSQLNAAVKNSYTIQVTSRGYFSATSNIAFTVTKSFTIHVVPADGFTLSLHPAIEGLVGFDVGHFANSYSYNTTPSTYYELAPGGDNELFKIDFAGNLINRFALFSSSKSIYTIQVTTNINQNRLTKMFSFTINIVAATGFTLSSTSAVDGISGWKVGTVANSYDTLSSVYAPSYYYLMGGSDNDAFRIDDNGNLFTRVALNAAVKSSYTIQVYTDFYPNCSLTKSFTITVVKK